MKINNRKGFNFYRSYYDVLQELPEQDQLAYLKAIIEFQFTGIEPSNLTGIAKLAFISQRHSIKRQLDGFQSGKKTPRQAPCQGPPEAPCQQVEVEVEEKVEEKEKEQVEVEDEKFQQLRQQVVEVMKRATHPQWHEDEYIEQAGQLLLKYPGKTPSKMVGLINTWCNNYKPKTGNKSIHQQRPQDQW